MCSIFSPSERYKCRICRYVESRIGHKERRLSLPGLSQRWLTIRNPHKWQPLACWPSRGGWAWRRCRHSPKCKECCRFVVDVYPLSHAFLSPEGRWKRCSRYRQSLAYDSFRDTAFRVFPIVSITFRGYHHDIIHLLYKVAFKLIPGLSI